MMGSRGFLSARDATSKGLVGVYPAPDRPGLRVLSPIPEYLFAMKAISMRPADFTDHGQGRDMADLEQLRERTGLTDLAAALELVSEFYPDRHIPPRTALGLEELFKGS